MGHCKVDLAVISIVVEKALGPKVGTVVAAGDAVGEASGPKIGFVPRIQNPFPEQLELKLASNALPMSKTVGDRVVFMTAGVFRCFTSLKTPWKSLIGIVITRCTFFWLPKNTELSKYDLIPVVIVAPAMRDPMQALPATESLAAPPLKQ